MHFVVTIVVSFKTHYQNNSVKQLVFIMIRCFRLFLQEISSVTRKHQNYVVKCEAQNVVGLSAATETLDVICMCAIPFYFSSFHLI